MGSVGATAGGLARRGACVVAVVLAIALDPLVTPTAHARAPGTSSSRCRAALRPTPLTRLPLPPGCDPIDPALFGSRATAADEGSLFFSIRGSGGQIVDFYRRRLGPAGFQVQRGRGAGPRCRVETELYKLSFACRSVLFDGGALHGAVIVVPCGRRAQVEVDFWQQSEPTTGIVSCLDPKGTGAVVKPVDARRYLREQLCRSDLVPMFGFPSPVFALDQLTQSGPAGIAGYENLSDVDRANCGSLHIIGVLQVTPGQTGWRLPAAYTEREHSSNQVPAVWLLARQGWTWLNAPGLFVPGEPIREAVEALPLINLTRPPRGAHGQPDLAFDTVEATKPGQACTPGEPVAPHWIVSIRNGGAATGPSTVGLEIVPPGAAGETRVLHWTRGLEPGESLFFGEFDPGASLHLDPRSQIEEADTANNELVLGPLPPLTCVPL